MHTLPDSMRPPAVPDVRPAAASNVRPMAAARLHAAGGAPPLRCAVLDDHVTLRLYTESIRRRGTAQAALRLGALQELVAFALAHDEALLHSRVLGPHAAHGDARTGPLDACTRLWMTLLLSDPAEPQWPPNFEATCSLMESALAREALALQQQRSLDPAHALAQERFVEARERALRLATGRITRLLRSGAMPARAASAAAA